MSRPSLRLLAQAPSLTPATKLPQTPRFALPPKKLTIFNNPYRAKTKWPPDFSNLTSQQQFRLEKMYRRRSKLKYARPRWNRNIKLLQWLVVPVVLTYTLLFMEAPEGSDMPHPFEEFREWFYGKLDSVWTTNIATAGLGSQEEARQKSED